MATRKAGGSGLCGPAAQFEILGLEPIAPGEGEVSAARRLLKRLYDRHCRYADKSDWYAQDQAGKKYRYRVKIWDAECFESWTEVKVPLRVLKIEETRIDGYGLKLDQLVITYLVTTGRKAVVPTETVWRILHRSLDTLSRLLTKLEPHDKKEQVIAMARANS